MTDQNERETRNDRAGSPALGGQGDDVDANGDEGVGLGLGDTRPGAGPNWTPGDAVNDPIVGGRDTGSRPGSWGNRSGSGSGGEGEQELDDEASSRTGVVRDDVTGTTGTSG